MKKLKLTTLLLLAIMLGFTSCMRELMDDISKLENIDGVKWNPEIATPLVSTRLTLGGILDQTPNNFITIDQDNLVHVIYRRNLVSMEAKDFASIPEQKNDGNITLTPFHINQLQNQGSTNLTFSTIFNFGDDNIEIDSLIMSRCALITKMSSTIKHDVTVKLSIPGITLHGAPFNHTFYLPYKSGGSNLNQTLQLQNHIFDLTKSGDKTFSQLLVNFDIEVTEVQGNPISPTDGISFNTDFKYNLYQWLYGDVGNIDATPDGADTMEFNLFNATNKGGTIGDFTVNNPRLKVIYYNSYGIPIRANINELKTFRPKDGYTTLTGYPSPIDIPTPTNNQVGQTLSDSFILDKSNSNLAALLNGLPDRMIYDFGVQINPPGTSERNFILYDSRVDFEIDVDIPLYGSANGFIIEADEAINLAFEDIEELESATLRMYTENQFPLDLGLQVYFVDGSGVVIDSLMEGSTYILKSPGIGADGRVNGIAVNTIDFVIPRGRLDLIKMAESVRIRGTLNTFKPSSGPQPEVKFFSDYGVLIKLGVKGRALINSKINKQ